MSANIVLQFQSSTFGVNYNASCSAVSLRQLSLLSDLMLNLTDCADRQSRRESRLSADSRHMQYLIAFTYLICLTRGGHPCLTANFRILLTGNVYQVDQQRLTPNSIILSVSAEASVARQSTVLLLITRLTTGKRTQLTSRTYRGGRNTGSRLELLT